MTKEKKQKLRKILRDKLEQLQKVPYEDLLKRVDGEPEIIEHGKLGSK